MARTSHIGFTTKSPREILDHTIDWSDVLVGLGDAIKDFNVTVPGDLVVWQSNFTELDTTVFLNGGTAGSNYTVTHTIWTFGGRVFQRAIKVRCIQKEGA